MHGDFCLSSRLATLCRMPLLYRLSVSPNANQFRMKYWKLWRSVRVLVGCVDLVWALVLPPNAAHLRAIVVWASTTVLLQIANFYMVLSAMPIKFPPETQLQASLGRSLELLSMVELACTTVLCQEMLPSPSMTGRTITLQTFSTS